MTTPAQDTAEYLASVGVASALAGSDNWPVFVGREPMVPQEVLTIYDTGGGPNILIDLRAPTVQVRVRSVEYLDGWVKSDEAYKALVTPIYPSTTDGVTLQWVAQGEIAYIGRNDADLCLFTCNFQLLRDGA